ncbi:MAG TPA: DUF5652 family protein [Chloroflexota bacterium]|nr:DUF5652 family protein [Chloroflexota bacterium]
MMLKRIQRLRKLPKPLLGIMILEAALKLFAAWRAVRSRQYVWAVALMVVNSGGLLPLLYLNRFQSRPRSHA